MSTPSTPSPPSEAQAQLFSKLVAAGSPGARKRHSSKQRRTFFEAGQRLCRERGAEAVMLGGTDLFLAFAGHDPGFPLIDCADIHVDAIYAKSAG